MNSSPPNISTKSAFYRLRIMLSEAYRRLSADEACTTPNAFSYFNQNITSSCIKEIVANTSVSTFHAVDQDYL
jgi:hypothetical protein